MTKSRSATSVPWIGVFAFAASAAAQTPPLEPAPVESITIDAIKADQPLSASAPLDEEPTPRDEDTVTRALNAHQRLEQTFTLRRTVNGELVETATRTLAPPRGDRAREMNAGRAARERVLAAYDGEVLSRLEALEEAKTDFRAGDSDQNGSMNKAEFEALVESWRADPARQAGASADAPDAREQRFATFLAEIRRESEGARPFTNAAKRFAFLAGASQTISREDYVREYMLDFDSMDANKDMLLEGDELFQFRALCRGETTEM